jgi:dipeptidyl-peptidase 4
MRTLRYLAVATLLPFVLDGQEKAEINYQKADLIRTSGAYVIGTRVSPNWLDDSVRFWFKSTGKDRGTIYLVDPKGGSRRILFDHNRMAAVLSVAADTILDPSRFPSFKLVNKDATLEVKTHKRTFHCDIASYKCIEPDTLALQRKAALESGPTWATRSPDKKWDAFLWKHNVYVRPAALSDSDFVRQQDSTARAIQKQKDDSIRKSKGEKVDAAPPKKAAPDTTPLPSGSIQLTTDGEYLNTYDMQWWRLVKEDKKMAPKRFGMKWSPDSKRIAVKRTVVKGTRIYPMYSSTKDQPEDRSYYFAAPGDSTVMPEYIHILDVAARTNIPVKDDPVPTVVHGMVGVGSMFWGRASDKLFALNATRGSHRVRANMIDANTGELKTQIARDSNATFVELQAGGSGANWAVVNDGEDVIWWSTRDGWGHLYRFDSKGTLKNQITSGPYTIQGISRVDSVKKQIYFTAWAKEPEFPYYVRLHRVNFDGTGLTTLTPEEASHSVTFVPKADYFIDTYSRADREPITVLRSAGDGKVIMELTRGDAALLRSIGWTPGELFTVKARDGVTNIYGVMYKPSDFDPMKKYPIITNIYPGPQSGSVSNWGFSGAGEVRALAELGFIVIQLNHLGVPGRSKWFHDHYYGNMGDNGLPDHIAGIRQLAARHPWIDINHVGIYGGSGGGYATADALFRHPDFFHVGVADAGNHHPATYGFFWAEKYQGLYNKASYDASANYTLAKNLKGHLLLMAGDLDSNVHPAATLKVVDALIKANKTNFDMLLVPDGGHGAGDYGTRMRWNYFVRYLLGKEPPAEYEMIKIDFSNF